MSLGFHGGGYQWIEDDLSDPVRPITDGFDFDGALAGMRRSHPD
jgi:hypothetical protein